MAWENGADWPGDPRNFYRHVYMLPRSEDPTLFGQSTSWYGALPKCNRDCVWTVARLISYVHRTTDHRQLCSVGNSASQSQLVFSQCAISLETLQVQSQCLVACCAYLEIQPSTFVPIHGDTGDDGDALELTSEGQMNNFQSQRFLEGTTMP